MHYSFKKTVYVDGDGRKNSYPSVVIENSEKYGSFFQDEINNLSLDYVEEIVGEIEAVLNGEVDFYEGFGFEVYMIECDREKAVVKNVYEDDQVEAIIPIEEVYELMRDWRDFQREYLSQRYLIIEMVGYTTSLSQSKSWSCFGWTTRSWGIRSTDSLGSYSDGRSRDDIRSHGQGVSCV